MSIPTVPTANLRLNPMQIEAIETITSIVEGKYRIVGTNIDDHTQCGIILDNGNDENRQMGKRFRVNDDGFIIPQITRDDVQVDIDNSYPAVIFAAMLLSYTTIFIGGEEQTQDKEFMATAAFAYEFGRTLGLPLSLIVDTIRAGARKSNLL